MTGCGTPPVIVSRWRDPTWVKLFLLRWPQTFSVPWFSFFFVNFFLWFFFFGTTPSFFPRFLYWFSPQPAILACPSFFFEFRVSLNSPVSFFSALAHWCSCAFPLLSYGVTLVCSFVIACLGHDLLGRSICRSLSWIVRFFPPCPSDTDFTFFLFFIYRYILKFEKPAQLFRAFCLCGFCLSLMRRRPPLPFPCSPLSLPGHFDCML